jgi:hypothetical protein
VPAHATVTLRVSEMPAHEALSWIVYLAGCRWYGRDNALFIHPVDKPGYGATLPRRLYDLGPLTAAGMPADAVRAVVEEFTRCDAYARATFDDGGRLAVTARQETHKALGQMLAGLARIPANGKASWPCPSPRDPFSLHLVADERQWPKSIRSALRKRISFDFVETPIQDAAGFIAGAARVNIIVHPALLADEAPTVTLRVKDMAAASALRWVCKLVNFRLLATENALLITGGRHVQRVRRTAARHSLCVCDLSAALATGWTAEAMMTRLWADSDGHPRSARACGARKVAVILMPEERADMDRTVEAALRGKLGPPPPPDDDDHDVF